MTAAAHFFQLKCIHHLSFRSFVYVFLGQINDLLGVHAARHLQSPHFAEIVFVLVSDDVAAGEALDRDDHVVWLDGCMVGFLDYCIMSLFLNQFLKIRNNDSMAFIGFSFSF